MTDEALLLAPLTEQAEALRTRGISAVELTQAYLQRIERLNPKVLAYITVSSDLALAQARAADAEIASGCYRGPLHGVPVGVKDQLFTKGLRTTGGSALLRDFLPDYDATVITKLQQAGAVLLGKQNMEEFALRGTRNHPYGDPRNPWDLTRIAGHSSSGSGAALAAGLCAAAVGEDTGGSIRNPGNVCNLVGLRPTFGRVSRHGLLQGSWSMDQASPIGRTAEDCALMLQAIAGHDPADALSSAQPTPDYRAGLQAGIRGLRLGVIRELKLDGSADPDVRAAVEGAIAALQGLGASVEEISLPLINLAGPLFVAIADTDAAAVHYQRLREHPEGFDQGTRSRLLAASLLPAGLYARAQRARTLLRNQMVQALGRFDAVISPMSARPALTLEEEAAPMATKEEVLRRQFASRNYTTPFALAGLPAASIPCGFSRDRLPIGFQVGAGPFAEATILRIAAAYQTVTDWHTQRAPLN
ncbi:MAG: hypothetical protein EXR52_07780 [Dehalococcoidia bacterium]|nr:hypothetical protein [Dehalococcoidia bacterium]